VNTKVVLPLIAAVVSFLFFLTGCQSPKAAPRVSSSAATRNNCCSLLHQLLNEQKDVSLLRFIKAERPEVKLLVKRIATTSGTAARLLEELARHDPSLRLDDFRLPPGELATRDAMAAAKQKELLSQTGDKFELALLLTQTEALGYAGHLAKVAAENEPQPERARALAGIGADMQNLYLEVFLVMLSKSNSAATNLLTPRSHD